MKTKFLMILALFRSRNGDRKKGRRIKLLQMTGFSFLNASSFTNCDENIFVNQKKMNRKPINNND